MVYGMQVGRRVFKGVGLYKWCHGTKGQGLLRGLFLYHSNFPLLSTKSHKLVELASLGSKLAEWKTFVECCLCGRGKISVIEQSMWMITEEISYMWLHVFGKLSIAAVKCILHSYSLKSYWLLLSPVIKAKQWPKLRIFYFVIFYVTIPRRKTKHTAFGN